MAGNEAVMTTGTKPWLLALLVMPLALAAISDSAEERASAAPDTSERVRLALLRLPDYGVFDLLSFQVKGDVVLLGGAAHRAILRTEAEEALTKTPGVAKVVDRIQLFPVSIDDDRVRREVFWKIYTDDFHAKYGAPLAGLQVGTRRAWGRNFSSSQGFGESTWGGAPFLGMEPVGSYAVHIIVENRKVSLFGAVSRDADRVRAGADARLVPGVRAVANNIRVVAD